MKYVYELRDTTAEELGYQSLGIFRSFTSALGMATIEDLPTKLELAEEYVKLEIFQIELNIFQGDPKSVETIKWFHKYNPLYDEYNWELQPDEGA